MDQLAFFSATPQFVLRGDGLILCRYYGFGVLRGSQ